MTELPYFSLENVDTWLQDRAYRIFQYSRGSLQSALSISLQDVPPPSHASIANPITPLSSLPVIKVESSMEDCLPLRGAVFATRLPVSSLDVIDISSDEEPSASAAGRKRKRVVRVKNQAPEVTIDISSDSNGSLSATSSSSTIPRRPKKAKMNKQQAASHRVTSHRNVKTSVRITTKEVVENIVHLDSVPTIWEVPRVPSAYVVDLSNDTKLPLGNDGNLRTLTSFIRQEVAYSNIIVLEAHHISL
jgi:hypothetical protein